MDFLELLKLQKKNEQEKLTAHRKIYASLCHEKGGLHYSKRKDGTMKYYIREKDSRIYVNADLRPRMDRIRLKKYLEKEIKCLEENQKLMERMISGYKKTDYDTINGELNDVYKGAFVPAAGVNWRNNIPLFTQSENPLYPDFSIPLEDEWFFIEHLGLLNKEKYVKRNAEKLHEYHSNGILMPGQLIFTMDGPDGGLDAGPVIEFLQNILLPRLWKSEADGLAAG